MAALLAVTAIPPPRKTQARRKRASLSQQQISIDELVHEWRNDSSLKSSSLGCSGTSLGLLLETADESSDERSSYSRSSSCDSLPSLDADDHSVISVGSPPTPESIRSQLSSQLSPRKEKSIFTVETEDCGIHHPLGLSPTNVDMDLDFVAIPAPKAKADRRKSSSFKSNLTSSLQALKTRALSSISSLNQAINQADSRFSDDSLWQHPYLFPRLSSEVRPIAFASTPTRDERRYFNPHPISFDEQQHHWRRALSTIDDDDEMTPMIQMQTYRRAAPTPPRKSRRNSGSSDSRSEAGRAQAAPVAVAPPGRQREVRENSNFLRVIVLEMNMRRKGKLEEGASGKAKIWLPPRKVSVACNNAFDDESDDAERALTQGPVRRRVPKRWVGISADY